MRYIGKHERKSNTGWVIISWLVAMFFIAMTYFSAFTEPSNFGWAIWLCIAGLWLVIALKETTKYLTTSDKRGNT